MRKINKIISLLFIIGCLFMMSSCNYSKEEKQILKEYEELSTNDFNEKYEYLNDKTNVFVSIRYEDLIKKLDSDTFILYVGGSWCPNCQAVVQFINQVAKANNIDKVYNFDTRISGVKTKENDIRNCNNAAQESLYRTFIETIGYVNPSGAVTEGTDIARLAVPAVFAVKNGKIVDVLIKEYFYNEEKDLLYVMGDEETNYKEEYLSLLEKLMLSIK
jgi:thiol-disulfide isomerase/thioredoxin